jgi:DtxR family Mn-dependent transcriptional regulator
MTPVRQRQALSQSQEDYLKALYELGSQAHGLVGTNELAERLRVSAPSAAQMLTRLADLGLVRHDRYHGSALTPAGEAVALEMVRHHRLLEMYLAKALGYRWDEVHDEAERLEHVISEQMEQRIYDALGRPGVDPHGDPIPTPAGELKPFTGRPLNDCRPGESVTVVRVSDRDPGKLRELSRLGLVLGATVELVRQSRYEGPLSVRVDGRRRQVALGVARAVFVK